MKTSVLLIDDDDLIAIQVAGILGDEFNFRHATTGVEGLLQVNKQPPDLVLLDVQLPDTDGYAVCRDLKADPATAAIPVIFVSAQIEVADRLAGYEAGGQDYITKPFAVDELRRKARQGNRMNIFSIRVSLKGR